jgi:hypothetical protein
MEGIPWLQWQQEDKVVGRWPLANAVLSKAANLCFA